jgi:hypothetical protein
MRYRSFEKMPITEKLSQNKRALTVRRRLKTWIGWTTEFK